jgi:hypothetical protein
MLRISVHTTESVRPDQGIPELHVSADPVLGARESFIRSACPWVERKGSDCGSPAVTSGGTVRRSA